MNPYKNEDLKKFFNSISPEEIDRQNRLHLQQTEKDFQEFVEKLKNGQCSLCDKAINIIDRSNPCLHWLTYPAGIKKKDFHELLGKAISFFRIEAYFRWLAHTENPLRNINDLADETSKNSFIETTIKYKNIEWSISIGNTDLDGHIGGKVGSKPHYHLQMLVDGNIFIKFNDFHIEFTDQDLFFFEMKNQLGEQFIIGNSHGMGMRAIEDKNMLKIIEENLRNVDDEETATFETDTLIMAPEGKTIPGKIIVEAMEESKRTKEPISKIMTRLMKEVKIIKTISPGKGVPEKKKRSGKK